MLLSKAELHLHLEGSIRPETLARINPALPMEEIEARYRYETFLGFLQNFGWIARNLKEPEHYAIATRDLLAYLETQQVTYAEITLAAGIILRDGRDLAGIHQAIREAAASSPIEVYWIWDAVRQWGVAEGERVAEAAVARKEDGVIAFGLGGDETNGPATAFREAFAYAKANGLRLVCHAGEWVGPESVWQALEVGAERIGHGVQSIHDAALVRHLAATRTPLEVSISSNVRTGSIASMGEHPVRRLYDAGVPIVLNTDDPPMFHTTLNEEYAIAAREFGFTEEELAGLAGNSFAYAFRYGRLGGED